MLRGKCIAIAAVVLISANAQAATAQAATAQAATAQSFALTGQRWVSNTSGTYCYDTGVSINGWGAIIPGLVNQYNSLPGYTHPTWTQGCGSNAMDFLIGNLDDGLCGYSQWLFNGAFIFAAHIYYRYGSSYGGPGSGARCDFANTTLHEFGHTQGLAHSCNSMSVMQNMGLSYQSLKVDDKYGHRYVYTQDPSLFPYKTAPC